MEQNGKWISSKTMSFTAAQIGFTSLALCSCARRFSVCRASSAACWAAVFCPPFCSRTLRFCWFRSAILMITSAQLKMIEVEKGAFVSEEGHGKNHKSKRLLKITRPKRWWKFVEMLANSHRCQFINSGQRANRSLLIITTFPAMPHEFLWTMFDQGQKHPTRFASKNLLGKERLVLVPLSLQALLFSLVTTARAVNQHLKYVCDSKIPAETDVYFLPLIFFHILSSSWSCHFSILHGLFPAGRFPFQLAWRLTPFPAACSTSQSPKAKRLSSTCSAFASVSSWILRTMACRVREV